MKKLCFLLALVLVLAGCSSQPTTQEPTQTTGKSGWVSFDLYAVNDLHGKILDTDTQPGVDELTTYLRQTENTILLATGDMWQGSSESNLTRGQLVTEWMNELDFAAMALGGHEFDWGEDCIRENGEMAEFPFLAINIYDRSTDSQADYCQSSVIVEVEDAKIGIIGAIGNCYYSIASENTKNVYFKTGRELTELVKAESEMLRSQGVDFIIYALHDGYDQTYDGSNAILVSGRELESYYDTELSNGYVDLVFEADSHYSYVLQDEFGVYHLQAGGNNSAVSHARVILDLSRGDVYVATAELVTASHYSQAEDAASVTQLLEKYAEQIASVNENLGYNSFYRSNYQLCQLVADLYCDKGAEKWGAEYDIVLGGGYISCRSPGYLPEGEVTYSQLQSLYPFDNVITLCSIRGSDLISRFLETDNDAYFIKTTAYGQSIRNSIDPNATYYVVTDSYSANYSYNRMTVIDTFAADIFARDLVAEYFTDSQ